MRAEIAVLATVLFASSAAPGALVGDSQSGVRRRAGTLRYWGEFSNVRLTKEHAYGFSLELWSEGSRIFGLLDVAEGLQGDTPTGLLQDVNFDRTSGRLSFTAKLSLGLHSCGTHPTLVPGRDVLKFSGMLSDGIAAGTMTRLDALHPEQKPELEHIVLKVTAQSDPIVAATYSEWRCKVETILRFRGPKW